MRLIFEYASGNQSSLLRDPDDVLTADDLKPLRDIILPRADVWHQRVIEASDNEVDLGATTFDGTYGPLGVNPIFHVYGRKLCTTCQATILVLDFAASDPPDYPWMPHI